MRRTHHPALQGMLLVRGAEAKYTPAAQLLLYNFRHLAVLSGLADRKHVAFTDAAWKDCAAITTGLMADLTELIVSRAPHTRLINEADSHSCVFLQCSTWSTRISVSQANADGD